MSNAAWAAIIVAVLAAASAYSWFFHRDRFLIIACHNALWAGALFLIGTDLIDYKESEASSWLMLVAGLVAFNVGVWLSTWVDRFRHRKVTNEPLRPSWAYTTIVTRRTLWVLFGLYAVGFASYLINIQVRYGLDTLLLNPGSIRGSLGPSYLETVPLPLRLLLYIAPLLFAILGVKEAVDVPLRLPVRLALMAGLAVTMLALLQRTNLFMGILLLFALLLSRGLAHQAGQSDAKAGRKRLLRLVAIIAIFAAVALVSFQAIALTLNKNAQQALSTGAVSPELARSGLTSPFVYYSAGTVAFLQLAQSTNPDWPPPYVPGTPDIVGDYNPQTWGLVTLAPVVKMVPFVTRWPTNDAFIDTGVSTNVYTWLAPFYRDFRLVGVILGPMLLGWILGTVFVRRFRSTRWFWLQAVLLSAIFMAPFVLKYNDTLVLCELLIIAVLTVRRPRWLRRLVSPPAARADSAS